MNADKPLANLDDIIKRESAAKPGVMQAQQALLQQRYNLEPRLERFLKNEPGDGPIKSFTLRGIKESPPYLHDGRLFTLEDTVEFFNLVLELKLTAQEKQDLVAFMRQL